MRKKITRIIGMAMCAVMITTTVLFATPMKDVSTSHWAYSEIIEMQKKGLLVPSSQGEFFPNQYVTYFEFSQILAKATGYQDEKTTPNMDPALKKVIQDNYAKQKSVIEAHQKNYQHWQKDANEEIAYLLGKGYLKKEDLGKFMSKSTSGVESKRGVRKQEAAVYLVRILHLEETAKQQYTTTGFKDEASINADARPHVAFLKSKGIISGDTNSIFGPEEPINRAILSKMLISTLNVKKQLDNPGTSVQPPAPTVPTNPGTNVTPEQGNKGLEGQLTKMISKGDNGYYVVIEIEPAKIHTYSIESNATVVDKDGVPISLSALKEKVDAKDTKAVNVTAQVSLVGTTEYMTYVTLNDSVENDKPVIEEKPAPDKKPTEDKDLDDRESTAVVQDITGTIYSVLVAPVPEITIRLENGNKKTYQVASSAEFYSKLVRKDISLWDLRLNQEVEAIVKGKEIRSLDVITAAPPTTLTGTISKTSINGDKIDIRVSYDSLTGESNVIRTIHVPMITQITDGSIERGRNYLKENMQVVVVLGEDSNLEPEQIVILSK